MLIRPEKNGDEKAIYQLTKSAFEPMPFSDGSEEHIIDELRRDGDLTISLVAIEAERLVGHVAFSPVTINDHHGEWFGLGPVSVQPDLQRQGIGSKLINEGLSVLKKQGAVGCALIGNPNYYCRFGFKSDGHLSYANVPTEYVQWLSFGDEKPKGILQFSMAFQKKY